MKKILFAMAMLSMACGGSTPEPQTAAAPAVHELTVDEVKTGVENHTLTVLDANQEATYQEHHIPGATWVGHEVTAANLPADHNAALVFYCFNESCGASHQVAQAAIALGYTNVSVLSAGIEGWIAAGGAVEASAATTATDTALANAATSATTATDSAATTATTATETATAAANTATTTATDAAAAATTTTRRARRRAAAAATP